LQDPPTTTATQLIAVDHCIPVVVSTRSSTLSMPVKGRTATVSRGPVVRHLLNIPVTPQSSVCTAADTQLSFRIINAHSLAKTNAFQTLVTEINSIQPDIVCVSETWLKPKHSNALFSIDGYLNYRLDRQRRVGGGVCLFCKYSLSPIPLNLRRAFDRFEYIWVRLQLGELYYCICVCYHPPKPLYSSADLLANLHDNFSELSDKFPHDVYVLTGDLNHLNFSSLLTDFGLCQIVDVPTRKSKTLDVVITNRVDLFTCNVAKSILKSDHLAIYVNCCKDADAVYSCANRRVRQQVKCYNRSIVDLAKLVDYFEAYNWNGIVSGIEAGILTVDQAFTDLVTILQNALDQVVGFKLVTLRDTDPPYITPAIRVLLRKRNQLFHRGLSSRAVALTAKIGKSIAAARANLLRKATASDTKQLWQLLRRTRNWSSKVSTNSTINVVPSFDLDVNNLNKYFADVATDANYSYTDVVSALNNVHLFDSPAGATGFVPYTSDFIAICLNRLTVTAPGPDGIPFWLYKTCAAQLSPVIAKLINYSIQQSVVPISWKTACITPVPKCSPVTSYSDLRPISVTPILSRLVEKIIVRTYLTPLLGSDAFYHQYAYKPTGSTTCALIDITHRIHTLLDTNHYVRCVLIDFSKAFDVIDHAILVKKIISSARPSFHSQMDNIISHGSYACHTSETLGFCTSLF
jgi:hypothetical protein